LAAWVSIWATLPLSVLPTATVMALYRVRQQVELAIKRLKSILQIDQLRARKDSLLADLYLHGNALCPGGGETTPPRGRCEAHRLDRPR